MPDKPSDAATETTQPELVLVAAVGENGVIGVDGAMPWHLSSDLKRFKRITLGCPVVMGRKTFQSIGRPLPGRENIVVSRDGDWARDIAGITLVSSLEDGLAAATDSARRAGASAVMVIGGGQIYAATIDQADRLEITRVHVSPKGDTRFPDIDPARWVEVARETPDPGPKDSAAMTFLTYRRVG
ncbi:dihydrofolate reductase [Stappia taiwanensis]|uniref:Dihydrofolate reductase n=1 Tax=Stappia taiwanensis TaxID=992267 RepID=A0A838XMY7_9HYPH|nr:dihydrofolate reductase [Stappia taiwanensis]MBA4610371.1 dihydrofolate reductase [Stappia taiwanensis]GGE85484.1 dihydrofolate reductase [Stappia taiwanensis]